MLWQGQEFYASDEVALLNSNDLSSKVAFGSILVVGGQEMFHGRFIPPHFVRVDLKDVVQDIHLMVANEEAEQTLFRHAMGSSILWFKDFIMSDTDGV